MQNSLERTIAALIERYDPASQKMRYQAELQTRQKKKTESWVDLAEDPCLLADKAYTNLRTKLRKIYLFMI